MSTLLSERKVGPHFFYKLYCFYFVVHCGSYSKASDYLHISPSSLTHMIQDLEERLKMCLLHRKGKCLLHLSPQGTQILSYSTQLVKLLENLEQSLGLNLPFMPAEPHPTISPILYSPEHLNKLFKELASFFSDETVCRNGLIRRLKEAMLRTV
jgi:DNA-binding transcriptional LysR family regulator